MMSYKIKPDADFGLCDLGGVATKVYFLSVGIGAKVVLRLIFQPSGKPH